MLTEKGREYIWTGKLYQLIKKKAKFRVELVVSGEVQGWKACTLTPRGLAGARTTPEWNCLVKNRGVPYLRLKYGKVILCEAEVTQSFVHAEDTMQHIYYDVILT